MSHTAGVNVEGYGGYDVGSAVPTLLQVLDGALPATTEPVRVIFTPGSRYSYSGGGMEVLQQMTEDASRMPFRSYMKSNVFDVLGMSSSDFIQPMAGPLMGRAAKAHDVDGMPVPGGWRIYPELIAAGLWTTPTDLAVLLVEVQKAFSGKGMLLTQETANRLLTMQPNSSMGLGFALINGRGGFIFNHSGSVLGFKSYASAYRDRGQGIVVMSNGDNGYALNMEIIRAVARVYGWPDEGISMASLVAVPLAAQQSYAGTYSAIFAGDPLQCRVYLNGGTLMIKTSMRGTGAGADLFPIAADTFLLRDNPIINGKIVFSTDGLGRQIFTITTPEGQNIVATRQ
jgi:CubicO group peptidase (beta-lactamase class C family)